MKRRIRIICACVVGLTFAWSLANVIGGALSGVVGGIITILMFPE